jgi:hypothetical protein
MGPFGRPLGFGSRGRSGDRRHLFGPQRRTGYRPVKILDTDVCIEILRGNRQVIARRRESLDEVATSWITAAELSYGAANAKHWDAGPQEDAVGNAFVDETMLEGFSAWLVAWQPETRASLADQWSLRLRIPGRGSAFRSAETL